MPVHQTPELAPLETGGRVEMRLISDAAVPSYEVRWFTSEREFAGSARIDEIGKPEVVVTTPGAPEWLVAWTAALLSVIARDHALGSPWPRRLTRWRASPADRS